MKKRTKQKIRRILGITAAGVFIGLALMIFNILGPFSGFFWDLPGLAGVFGSQQYLLIVQNNNELRPTGGFITAVGQIDMSFGFPDIQISDSYQVPNPENKIKAPEPFEYLIGQHDPFFAGWTLRDANFSPDFPTSSQDIITLYQQAHPEVEIDAVISIDFAVMETLLDLYGPITVEGTTFDKNNFFILSQRLSKNIDTHNAEELANRKNILKPFAKILIDRIIKTPGKYGRLMDHIFALGQQKHILAYSIHDDFQAKLSDYGLTQQIKPSRMSGDFLHLNVANIGGRKADRYVTKDIKYKADFSNPQLPQSTLDITFEHLGSYNIQSDIYQAYVRAYVPLGSKLLGSSTTGLQRTERGQDLNLTTFADYIRIKPGEKVTLSYTYQLPDGIIPEQYDLEIIKQPGIQNQYWQVSAKHMNDSLLSNGDGNGLQQMDIRENLAIWRGELQDDMRFRLIKSADSSAPLILWQEFVELNKINVRFQELIDREIAENIENYQIVDLNKADAETTDEISILSAEFDERDLWLFTEGISTQYEEHYEITLKDIQDIYGNVIQPNPITRTLVQRLEDEEE